MGRPEQRCSRRAGPVPAGHMHLPKPDGCSDGFDVWSLASRDVKSNAALETTPGPRRTPSASTSDQLRDMRGLLAAFARLDFELHLLTFVERAKSQSFDRREVDKYVRRPVGADE